MLHTAEGSRHLTDGFVTYQAVHHGDGSHVVFHVMYPGNQNLRSLQHFFPMAADHPVHQAHVRLLLPGEEQGLAVTPEGGGDRVVGVENQDAAFILVAENVGFRLDIFRHVLVNVQMIGCQIGNHRPGGTALHVHELEGAKLHHRKIRGLHLPHQRQQRRSDIATQPDGFPLGFQHFGDQGGSGGFPVGAGHRQDGTGADLKENLHLAGDLSAPAHQGLDCRVRRVHSRGTENHIRLHAIQIIFPDMQSAARLFQLQHLPVQLFPGGFVAAGDIAAEIQQQPHQRPIADTQTQHRDFFVLQRVKILRKPICHLPFLA